MKKREAADIRFINSDALYQKHLRHQRRREALHRLWQRVKDWFRGFFH